MRFQNGSHFAAYTNSAATTCSFTVTAASRHLLIDTIIAQGDLSGGIVTLQASGTTLWAGSLGSASLPVVFNGLHIDCGDPDTVSANLTASSLGGYLSIHGLEKL